MLEIIIILVIIGIIANIIMWIKDHIEAILGIIIIVIGIGVVIAVGCALIPIILPFLPYVILFSLPCVIIHRIIMKIRSYSYRKWINSVGIGPQSRAPGSKGVWKWAQKRNHTVELGQGYILSTKFRNAVLSMVDQQMIADETAFLNDCLQVTPNFQPVYVPKFLAYLTESDMLLAVDESGRNTFYLSRQLKKSCERCFESEGAATQNEFLIICQEVLQNSDIAINTQAVAKAVLNHLVSQGAAHVVKLPDLEDNLFVSNRNTSNSKMTRREISLD